MYGKYSNEVEYEYRGKRYFVEYPVGMTYYCTAPAVQHRNAQAEIDEEIEREKNPMPYRKEDSAEYGFELFWEMVEG